MKIETFSQKENIIKYNNFINENVQDDDLIIKEIIIPFSIKKYYDLSKWAKKKINEECPQLKQVFITIYQNKWRVIFVSPELRDNKAYILIQYVLAKSIREECIKNSHLESIHYLMFEFMSDRKDKRKKDVFDYVCIPKGVNKGENDIDFTKYDTEDFLKEVMKLKD